MEPIINPWVFYLVDRVDVWHKVVGIIAMMAFMSLFVKYLFDVKSTIINKYSVKALVITVLMLSFLPSSSTIYKMIIADNATPNNIQIVGDTVEDGIDYIFDKINEVVEEKEAGNE